MACEQMRQQNVGRVPPAAPKGRDGWDSPYSCGEWNPLYILHRRQWKRVFAFGLLGAIGVVVLFCSCKRAKPGEPGAARGFNVLLITMDTTRPDGLACYGNRFVKTPVLDKLAREGVLFEQCTTCAPITLPSHVSIMTATYPFMHGTRINGRPFVDEGNVTLAEMLRKENYTTGAEVASFILDACWGIDQGFESFRGVDKTNGAQGRQSEGGERTDVINSEPADVVCDRAIEWLTHHESEPFFQWVHFWDPHHPYNPPEPYRTQYKDPYLGEIAFMDEQIGRLLEHLKASGLERKTVVVVVADHGEAFIQHREGTHLYFVYDSTIHVPLLFKCPERIPKGRRIDAQVRTVDIVPTILDLLGMAPKPDAQGVSLLPLISGEKDDLHLAAYGETMSPHLEMGYAQLRCLRAGGWKYVHAPTPELYDVTRDWGEMTNVAERHPAVVADMRDQLESLIESSAPAAVRGGSDVPLDSMTAARLASLGYLAGSSGGGVGDELRGFLALEGPDPKDRIDVHIEYMKAKSYMGAGAQEKAAEILESLTRREPDNPAVWRLLANLRRVQGHYEEAVQLYRRVIELGHHVAVTHYHLGRALGELGRHEEAIEHFHECIRQLPQYPEAHAYLALALARQGMGTEALASFQEALDLDPAHEQACIGLSALLDSQGAVREAMQVLRAGLHRCPKSVTLANNLAWRLATVREAELRDGAEAVRLAESSRKRLGVEDPKILDTLAAAYAEVGQFPKAVELARRALELADPENAELAEQVRLRLALYESGRAYREGS
ncbi:MAG: sulfatase-like hydrolase/transferase [Phycisphaerae bacterium]|nr:sulfatase-like hydrolase/transferase [Phycisphaerae bacterium]